MSCFSRSDLLASHYVVYVHTYNTKSINRSAKTIENFLNMVPTAHALVYASRLGAYPLTRTKQSGTKSVLLGACGKQIGFRDHLQGSVKGTPVSQPKALALCPCMGRMGLRLTHMHEIDFCEVQGAGHRFILLLHLFM